MKPERITVGNAFCLLWLALASFGCMGTKVHFEDVSLEKVDLTRGRMVEGSSSGFQLLCLIPISINDRQEDAYWKLKKAAGSDFVTDISITESWTWCYIGTLHKTRFTGTAYPERKSVNTEVPATVVAEQPSLSKKLDELKVLHDKNMLTDKEYEAARARIIEQFK